MTIFNVTNASGLANALANAQGGDTILLAPGGYGKVTITNLNFASNVTIASASGTNWASLKGLHLHGCSGLTFSHLTFSTIGTVNPSSTVFAKPFSIVGSQNIQLANLNVHGTSLIAPASQPDGLLVSGCSNVSVTGSKFQYTHVGLADIGNNNITISQNSFSQIGNDGIDNGGSSYVKITRNTFADFNHANSTQHADAIQFWTSNTTTSAHDIIVSNNMINLAGGTLAQGIFITDAVGNLPYQNLTVSNNTVIDALGNGIELENVANGVVTGNDVLTLTNEVSGYGQVTSRIVLLNDNGVTLEGNHANGFSIQRTANLTLWSNTLTQSITLDFVLSSTSMTVPASSHSLVVTGSSTVTVTANNRGDVILANDAGDTLIGGAGNDTLVGAAGNDLIQAGAGADTLFGGGGANTFQFGVGTGQEAVADFAGGVHNLIDISALLATGANPHLAEASGNAVISFDHNPATITLLGVDYHSLISTAAGFTI
jgi:Ca2+-binding RTX toxin-like protein